MHRSSPSMGTVHRCVRPPNDAAGASGAAAAAARARARSAPVHRASSSTRSACRCRRPNDDHAAAAGTGPPPPSVRASRCPCRHRRRSRLGSAERDIEPPAVMISSRRCHRRRPPEHGRRNEQIEAATTAAAARRSSLDRGCRRRCSRGRSCSPDAAAARRLPTRRGRSRGLDESTARLRRCRAVSRLRRHRYVGRFASDSSEPWLPPPQVRSQRPATARSRRPLDVGAIRGDRGAWRSTSTSASRCRLNASPSYPAPVANVKTSIRRAVRLLRPQIGRRS